jgi:hypothetical protein
MKYGILSVTAKLAIRLEPKEYSDNRMMLVYFCSRVLRRQMNTIKSDHMITG